MSIIALRAWYLEDYEPIAELEKRPPDIRLSKKSLLKTGLRVDFLEDSEEVKKSTWFGRYLAGENIEFYIEGSGGYYVANIDLISHEIYFTKQTVLSQLEPIIFLSYQTEYSEGTEVLRTEVKNSLEILNKRARIPLTLIESYRPESGSVRLSSSIMRKIRKSLLFIADATPITSINQEQKSVLIPSPNVCIEIGYAMQSKRNEQILLAHLQRPELSGDYPFDLATQQVLQFANQKELSKILTQTIENQLFRYRLFV